MIGPELPPHLQRPKNNEEEESSDDEDAFLPELPPDLKGGAKGASSTPSPSTSGPSASASGLSASKPFAPASTSKPSAPTRPPSAPASYDDDDSDDDVGPKPLGAPAVRHDENEGIRRFLEVEQRRREEAENASKPKTLQRESWMLVPPSASELLSNIDPTKKRTFSTSTLAPASSRKKNEPNLWTETPQERLQRLKDEVMGRTKGETEGRRKRAVNPVAGDDGDDEEGEGDRERAKRRKVEEEHQRNVGEGVEEYTRKIRGPSLTEAHLERERQKAASKAKRDESDPDPIWDRDRDLGVGGRIFSDGERKKALHDARSGLGERFGSGGGGRFM
ncbi:hypothetical protein EV714DRAFT_275412 [Schizophyllum commune]